MTTLLRVRDVTAGYGKRPILHGVSLRIRSGERVLLAGPNGCGKTTLLRVLAGLVNLQKGDLVLAGRGLAGMRTDRRMRLGLGYLMQTHNIFPSLSVDDNLRLGHWNSLNSFASQQERVLTAFPDLAALKNRRAGVLSGGQRQLLALAIVLMRPISLLMLDEPTAGLSPGAAEKILGLLASAQASMGFASIVVEHHLPRIAPRIDRALIMRQGRIILDDATPEQLLDPGWLETFFFERIRK